MSAGRLIWAVLWRALVVVVLFGILLIAAEIPGEGKSFEITEARTHVELREDASLRVAEQLRFEYSGGTFSGAYRDIPTREGARITDVAVFEGDRRYQPGASTRLGSSDRPGSFGVTDLPEGDGVRVVWHYDKVDDTKTFILVYDVVKAITAYDGVLDVGWTVWGDQWDFWLDELGAEIVTPDGSDPTEAWVSSFEAGSEQGTRFLDAEPEIADGRASFETERAPEGENVVFRALVPRDAVRSITGARLGSGDGTAKVREEEAAISADQGAWAKARNGVFDNAWLLFGGWTLLVVAISIMLAIRAREVPTSVARHLPEPPEEVPPAVAYALATEGEYDDRVVLATLLDLVDRGYYDAKASQGDDLDLELSVSTERPAIESLTDYERETVGFFDELLGGKTIALSKLKDEVPEHSATWRTRWNELTTSLDQADEGQIDWDRDLVGTRFTLAFVAFLGYALLGALYFGRTHWIALPVAALVAGLLFIYLLPATMYKRLDPEARERNARWAAFKRWTEDFPKLSDDPPATLKLWRSILVYAVAFGSAERVAKSGRIPAPVGEEAAQTGSWTVFALHGGSWNSDFNSFSSDFSSQVAPESSSGGGGGGGGFSGGGGGGAW